MSSTINKKLNYPLPISMEMAVALDYNSMFTDYASAVAAASGAVAYGSYGSKNYIGQVITVADSERGIYKSFRIDANHELKELAAEFEFENGVQGRTNPVGSTVIGLTPTYKNNIDYVYRVINLSSDDWSSTYTSFRANSGRWENTTTHLSSTSGRWESVYSSVNSVSGKWNNAYIQQSTWSGRWIATYHSMAANSGDWSLAYQTVSSNQWKWNAAYASIESTSAQNQSVYSAVHSTSSEWNRSVQNSDRILSRTPESVREGTNEYADKKYVTDSVRDMAGTFRGSFSTWGAVPSTSAGYNSDISGNKTPLNNDFMVVHDDSSNTIVVDVNASAVGEKLAEDITHEGEIVFSNGHVLITADIDVLIAYGKTTVLVYRTGSWRYRFVGTWVEGAVGKNRWKPEYRLNDTPLTTAQMEALNSGITLAKTRQISKNAYDITRFSAASSAWNQSALETMTMSASNRSVYSSVSETSGTWNTVTNKVGNDYFKYYSASAWSILTDDDTNYSHVPTGFIMIYEDEGSSPTPVVTSDLSIYTKDNGRLLLSKNVSYDFDQNILYIGGAASFNTTSCTLTIPGSSDATTPGHHFNPESNLFTFADSVLWDAVNGRITLTDGDSYNSTTGVLTLNSAGAIPERTTFTVTTHLQHATVSPVKQYVSKNEQYNVVVTVEPGYTLRTFTCTMGGVNITPAGETSFSIDSVTGDIILTALADWGVSTEYQIINNLVNCTTNSSVTSVEHGGYYTATITPCAGFNIVSKSCLMENVEQPWVDNSITIDYVANTVYISVVASSVSEPLTFDDENGIMRFGGSVQWNGTSGCLTLTNSDSYQFDANILVLNGRLSAS